MPRHQTLNVEHVQLAGLLFQKGLVFARLVHKDIKITTQAKVFFVYHVRKANFLWKVQSLALTALKDIIKQRQGNTYVKTVKKENMTLKSPKTIVLVNYVV